jgi:hypothetical protein
VPAPSSTKRSAGFIFVFDHEAPGYDIDDVAFIAPMICFETGTVDDKAQGDVAKVASSGRGSACLTGLDNSGDTRPVDHADWEIFEFHDVPCEAISRLTQLAGDLIFSPPCRGISRRGIGLVGTGGLPYHSAICSPDE